MVGPNKQFDKAEVLDKAMKVFWEKGYEATSMQDLVDSMGINRASMYQTYGNKYSLFVATIDRYIQTTTDLMNQVLQQPGSEIDKLKSLFKIMVEHSFDNNQKGCLINNTAIELAPHDADIANILRDFFKFVEQQFEHHLQQAQHNKQLNPAINIQQLAALLNINLQGLMVLSKTSISKHPLLESIDSIFNLIQK